MKNVVQQLAKNKEFGSEFVTDYEFWMKIEEIVTTLSPMYNLTVATQRIGYGLADFYIGWLRVKTNLSRIIKDGERFNLAENLLKFMDKRASSLFTTPLFLCAVYLDARMMFTLSPEQKAEAAMSVVEIYERIMKASHSNGDTERQANDTLDEIHLEFQAQQGRNQSDSDKIIELLSIYEIEKIYDIRAPVMQFWEENEEKYKLIRPIVDLIHAVPANQCRTEQAFSSLSYLRSKYRMRMAPKTLANVLMIRLNQKVWKSLREERIRAILD